MIQAAGALRSARRSPARSSNSCSWVATAADLSNQAAGIHRQPRTRPAIGHDPVLERDEVGERCRTRDGLVLGPVGRVELRQCLREQVALGPDELDGLSEVGAGDRARGERRRNERILLRPHLASPAQRGHCLCLPDEVDILRADERPGHQEAGLEQLGVAHERRRAVRLAAVDRGPDLGEGVELSQQFVQPGQGRSARGRPALRVGARHECLPGRVGAGALSEHGRLVAVATGQVYEADLPLGLQLALQRLRRSPDVLGGSLRVEELEAGTERDGGGECPHGDEGEQRHEHERNDLCSDRPAPRGVRAKPVAVAGTHHTSSMQSGPTLGV